MSNTPFSAIYDCFLSKVTDDLYIELTPEDTLRDLQSLLLNSLPGFEFPRCNLNDYTLDTVIKPRSEVVDGDFVLGLIWREISDSLDDTLEDTSSEEQVLVENSTFNFSLTPEEINIIASLMMQAWVQRQVTSIEHTRMKYSGTDFKMTSQANHLQKLMGLLNNCKDQLVHLQRLYKRRRIIANTDTPFDGRYRSNWDIFGKGVYYDRYSN